LGPRLTRATWQSSAAARIRVAATTSPLRWRKRSTLELTVGPSRGAAAKEQKPVRLRQDADRRHGMEFDDPEQGQQSRSPGRWVHPNPPDEFPRHTLGVARCNVVVCPPAMTRARLSTPERHRRVKHRERQPCSVSAVANRRDIAPPYLPSITQESLTLVAGWSEQTRCVVASANDPNAADGQALPSAAI
jgi:hypothetical protein